MAIVFGRVPHPDFLDRLIPDHLNRAWNDLGQRTVRGVVYHRQQGPSNQGTENYFQTIPPGGLANCPGPGEPVNFDWGGCNGLTDYGVDQHNGEIRRWNDPLGRAHPGVSPNRAGWASGPVSPSGAYGDGRAFLLDNGWNPEGGPNQAALHVVNRDQVSIEIAGFFDDPISGACKDAVAALSAYWADQAGIPWDVYPRVPGKDYNFTRWHEEFRGHSDNPPSCPGKVVIDETTDIINRTIAILKRHQLVDGEGPPFEPFQTIRIFHVPASVVATGRAAPDRGAAIVQSFLPGTAIESDGFFRGESVDGENRWIRTSGSPHLAIHKSGILEEI